MTDDPALFEIIEQYLKGALSPEDTRRLEARAAADPVVAAQIDRQKLERDAMEVILENDLRREMSQWSAERKQSLLSPVPRTAAKERRLPPAIAGARRQTFRWAVAAGVALLSVFGLWRLTDRIRPAPSVAAVPRPPAVRPDTPASVSVEQTIPDAKRPAVAGNQGAGHVALPEVPADHFRKMTPEPSPVVSPNDRLVDIAETAYQNNPPDLEGGGVRGGENAAARSAVGSAWDRKDYRAVIAELKNTPVDAGHFSLVEMLAHAYFQSKQYARATPLFEQLLGWSGSKSREKMQWYLLLCYLTDHERRQKDFDALARQIIAEPRHGYNLECRNILEQTNQKTK